jgi:hypothetical protein
VLTTRRTDKPCARNQFLVHLPRFQAHADYAHRHIHCPETRSDLTAETIALAWMHFLRLVERGKDPSRFITTLALRCSQAVRAGRRLAGSERISDVLSPITRARHGYSLEKLDDLLRADVEISEALSENTQSEVLDQVAFRMDFPRWRRRLGVRNRRVLNALMVGEGTKAVARQFGLSPGRVSQMRREFKESWERFQDL